MNISITVSGEQKVKEKLASINRITNDVEPELKTISQEMIRFFSLDVFESTGGELGEHWPQLAASTLRDKQKHYSGKGTLERTSAMRYGYYAMTSPTQARIRNKMPYAVFHQFGTKRMPRRKLMGMSGNQAQRIKTLFTRSLQQRLENA